MSIHKGHRARVRERFLREGLDGFEEHEVLEMLLFYCVARKDTNEMAHRLLEEFGSLPMVLSATPVELQRVTGVNEGVSTFFSFINELERYRSIKTTQNEGNVLRSVEACGKYLSPFFQSRRNEEVYLLCLDAKCKVIGCKRIGEGSVNSAGVPIRRIVEVALNLNATAVVLAHNHPSGLALPSGEDIHTTRLVAQALQAVDVVLADHIIVADDEFVSLKQSNYFLNEDVFCEL